jgi:predicted transcriptional regulator
MMKPMSENRFHWGPGWKNDKWTWIPHDVQKIMRDDLRLTLSQICALQVLVSFRQAPDEYVVWSSVETVADRMGTTYATARRALKSLIKRDVVQEKRKPSRKNAREYDLYKALSLIASKRVEKLKAQLEVV